MKSCKYIFRQLSSVAAPLLVLAFVLGSIPLMAQEEEEEEEGPLATRMSISVVQSNDEAITLKGLVRARIDGRYTGIPGLAVDFQDLRDTMDTALGQAETDENGIATLKLKRSELTGDSLLTFSVAAVFEGNEEFGDSDDDTEFTAADLSMDGFEEDSTRFVTVRLTSGGEPVAETEVALFAKGMIKPLPIAEAETDENGEATFEFPLDLPGNPDGTIDIRAYVEDSDEFASIESWLAKDWGVARISVADGPPRELWSTNPPLWMFLVFIGILVFIWGHYLKVIYDLFKLKKLAKAENQAA